MNLSIDDENEEFVLPKFVNKTNVNKWWPYQEYYLSDEKDCVKKSLAKREYHWTGAESLESYHGTMLNNTMHGYGEYRCRHKENNDNVTYEGYFYANRMHGYGVMSYADGTTFNGLFKKDVRYGPGIETEVNGSRSQGFWCGKSLIRMAWKPRARSPFPDLTKGSHGISYLYLFRTTLLSDVKIIGATTNTALELLKSFGCDPIKAAKIWPKLYSNNCSDPDSPLFNKDLFDDEYYNGKIDSLLESALPSNIVYGEDEVPVVESIETKKYLAWNNSCLMVDIMKHCYQHETQRPRKINLTDLLNGPKKAPLNIAKHEIDCRSLLLASYLGYIDTVAEIVNHAGVNPDVADIEGNTAIMYAVCGDQFPISRFLVEAGGSVNCVNDFCYTPLGLALMRYLMVFHNISNRHAADAFLSKGPQYQLRPDILNLEEWLKDVLSPRLRRDSIKSVSSVASTKSSPQAEPPSARRKSMFVRLRISTVDSLDEDRPYDLLKHAYATKASTKLHPETGAKYLFQVKDIFSGVGGTKSDGNDDTRDITERRLSRISKQSDNYEDVFSEPQRLKRERMFAAYETILQLLKDGADPKLVKCPWPALLMAIKTGSPEIVRQLAQHGADLNEIFPEQRHYRAIDIVMADPLTMDGLEIVKILLEYGADVTHSLPHYTKKRGVTGITSESPNLFHVLMTKRVLGKRDLQMIELCATLLLQHNCDPHHLFKGQSAIGMAMKKSMTILDAFITHPHINLNIPVNASKHSILFRIFHKDFFLKCSEVNLSEMVTGLLLHGADPLIPCLDGERSYINLFVFTKKNMREMTRKSAISALAQKGKKKIDSTSSKILPVKSSKSIKSSLVIRTSSLLGTRSSMQRSRSFMGRAHRASSLGLGFNNQYGTIVEVLRNATRKMYIRRIQAKLWKELVNLIYKFKHWSWNTIVRLHKNRELVGMWLNLFRCLELWTIFKNSNKKKYQDEAILKYVLAMVLYYQTRIAEGKEITPTMSTTERYSIDAEVKNIIKQYKKGYMLTDATNPSYIKPEFNLQKDEKYNVCFECFIPLSGETITCNFCGLVSFCNLICLSANTNRADCHPCSKKLNALYFPPTVEDIFLSKTHPSFSMPTQTAASNVTDQATLSYGTASSTNARKSFSLPQFESNSPRDSFYLPPSVTNLRARHGFSLPATMSSAKLRQITSLSILGIDKERRESDVPSESASSAKLRHGSSTPTSHRESATSSKERRESASTGTKERRESISPTGITKERRQSISPTESAPAPIMSSLKMRRDSDSPDFTSKNKPVTFEDTKRRESASLATKVTIKDTGRRKSVAVGGGKEQEDTLPDKIMDGDILPAKGRRKSVSPATFEDTKTEEDTLPAKMKDTGRRKSVSPATFDDTETQEAILPDKTKDTGRRKSVSPAAFEGTKTEDIGRRKSVSPAVFDGTKTEEDALPAKIKDIGRRKSVSPAAFEGIKTEDIGRRKSVSPAAFEDTFQAKFKDIGRRKSMSPTVTGGVKAQDDTLPDTIRDTGRRRSALTATKRARQRVSIGTKRGAKPRRRDPYPSPSPSTGTHLSISHLEKDKKFSLPSIPRYY